MKTLSIIASLVIGLALAWTSFAPQPVDAADIIGACGTGPFGPCTSTLLFNCEDLDASCCNNYDVHQCLGAGSGECYDTGLRTCYGTSPCNEYFDQEYI